MMDNFDEKSVLKVGTTHTAWNLQVDFIKVS